MVQRECEELLGGMPRVPVPLLSLPLLKPRGAALQEVYSACCVTGALGSASPLADRRYLSPALFGRLEIRQAVTSGTRKPTSSPACRTPPPPPPR